MKRKGPVIGREEEKEIGGCTSEEVQPTHRAASGRGDAFRVAASAGACLREKNGRNAAGLDAARAWAAREGAAANDAAPRVAPRESVISRARGRPLAA